MGSRADTDHKPGRDLQDNGGLTIGKFTYGVTVIDGKTTGNFTIKDPGSGNIAHLIGCYITGVAGTLSLVRFEDGSGGDALIGAVDLSTGTAGDGMNHLLLPPSKDIPWASTSAGAVLNMEITGQLNGVVMWGVETL